MFRSVGLYRGIRCPAAACRLPNCLFSHERPAVAPTAAAPKKARAEARSASSSSPAGGAGASSASPAGSRPPASPASAPRNTARPLRVPPAAYEDAGSRAAPANPSSPAPSRELRIRPPSAALTSAPRAAGKPPIKDIPAVKTVKAVVPFAPAQLPQRLAFAQYLAKVLLAQGKTTTPNLDAIAQEYDIARSSSRATYVALIKLHIAKAAKGEVAATTNAPRAAVERPYAASGLPRDEMLAMLGELVLRPSVLGHMEYVNAVPAAVPQTASHETCDRCATQFVVATPSSECRFHWARPRREVAEPKKRYYPCCNEPVGTSTGCTTFPRHVFKLADPVRMHAAIPFKTHADFTAAPSVRPAVSIDCEMSYTTRGLELVRVTILDFPSHTIVLDELVRPAGDVIDYNTRFSGVKSLTSATHTLDSVRAKICQDIIGPDTVVIGHAGFNDLIALRIVHEPVVDTAVLFPYNYDLLSSYVRRLAS
ncbi:uncharacterized protein V1510DRAFT_345858, partial [Dipodascopsis tothii]|uniref:uncharacterized protein n=1 Tax=Dipodascopsis tothii TaxID=44089 RepID=UPI0034CFBCCA